MQNQEAVIQEGFSSVRHGVSLLERTVHTVSPYTRDRDTGPVLHRLRGTAVSNLGFIDTPVNFYL